MIPLHRAGSAAAASALISAALALPARSYDLQYRPPIEPLPRSEGQGRQHLSDLAARYARPMLENRSRILSQP
jgi:hypothetical protein